MVLLKTFRETPILYDEVAASEVEGEKKAIDNLEDKIKEMKRNCEEQISNLSKRTQDLITLVSFSPT